jgi:sodium pump decarboxylase gamma subunit
MLDESFTLMLVGMGTVFVFLTMLVVFLQASASFFASWPDDDAPEPTKPGNQDDYLIEIAIALAAIERSDA